MWEESYSVGDFRATVFAIKLRNSCFRAQVVIQRVGQRARVHRTELFQNEFDSASAALAHGKMYLKRWLQRLAVTLPE